MQQPDATTMLQRTDSRRGDDFSLAQLAHTQDKERRSAPKLTSGRHYPGLSSAAVREQGGQLAPTGVLCHGHASDDYEEDYDDADSGDSRSRVGDAAASDDEASSHLSKRDIDVLRTSIMDLRLALPPSQRSPAPPDDSAAMRRIAESASCSLTDSLDSDTIPEIVEACADSPGRELRPSEVVAAGALAFSIAPRQTRPLSATAAATPRRQPIPPPPATLAAAPPRPSPPLAPSATDALDGALRAARPAASALPLKPAPGSVERAARRAVDVGAIRATDARSDAAASAPENGGVLEQLRAQAEQRKHRDPKMALLGRVLDKCTNAARVEGVSVSAVLERLLLSTPTKPVPPSSGGQRDLTGRAAPPKVMMRPPRGLELEAAAGTRTNGSPNAPNELVLRILGAHDDAADLVGLTAIELFDADNNKIELAGDQISVRGGEGAGASRLLGGRGHTTNGSHMWTSPFPPKGARQHLELVILLPSDPRRRPAALKVWNYNRSVQHLGIGVLWMAIFLGSHMLTRVKLQKGCGNASIDYSQTIALGAGRAPPRAPRPGGAQPAGRGDARLQAAADAARPSGGKASAEAVTHAAAAVEAMSDAQLLAELQRRGLSPAIALPEPPAAGALKADDTPLRDFSQKRISLVGGRQALACDSAAVISCAAPALAQPRIGVPEPSRTDGQGVPAASAAEGDRRKEAQDTSAAPPCVAAARPCDPPPQPAAGQTRSSPPSTAPPARDRTPASGPASAAPLVATPSKAGGLRHANAGRDEAAPRARRDANQESSPESATDAAVPAGFMPRAVPAERGVDERAAKGRALAERTPLDGDLALLVPVPQRAAAHTDAVDVLGDLAPPRARRRNAAPDAAAPVPRERLVPDLDAAMLASDPAECSATVAASLAGGRAGTLPGARRRPPADLQQSLDSLSLFQRNHRGRFRDGTAPAPPSLAATPPPKTSTSSQDALDINMPVRQTATPGDVRSSADCTPAAHTSPLPTAHAGGTGAALATLSLSDEMPRPFCPAPAFLSQLDGDDPAAAGAAAPAPRSGPPGQDGEAAAPSTAAAPPAAAFPAPDFRIPHTPRGRVLTLRLHSTWGDAHYIGLSSVEIFDARGATVLIEDPLEQVTASPHSVNDLPECSADPRTPDKLVDGVHLTCSDLHQWLAPYVPGADHTVTIDLGRHTSLGMIRVWNYNKSRIHAERGVRGATFLLDDTCIFQGELTRAPGSTADAARAAECIVFTDDEAALDAIDVHDLVYQQPVFASEAPPDGSAAGKIDAFFSSVPDIELVTAESAAAAAAAPVLVTGNRPMTSALLSPPPPALAAALPRPLASPAGVSCCRLEIDVLSTWGDAFYVGLTGLQVLGADGAAIALPAAALDACPRDLNAIPGFAGDDRTLDKLVDGVCVTKDDRHMWLAPVETEAAGGPLCEMSISLGADPVVVTGLRVWNYNKLLEGTYRGVQLIRIRADGRVVSGAHGVVVPKAPGVDDVDFGHVIPLPLPASSLPQLPASPRLVGPALALCCSMRDPGASFRAFQAAWQAKNHNLVVKQDFHTPLLPCGFFLKLVLWSSWGDAHYVGLTGIEVYDAGSGLVELRPEHVVAAPISSVAALPQMSADVRTPAKLVDGINSGAAEHSWLAPRPPAKSATETTPNVLMIRLPYAVALSKLRLWNYAKTATRGVCEVDILLDDELIYKGFVAKATPVRSEHQCIMFTNAPAEVALEGRHVRYNLDMMERDHLTLVNERVVKKEGRGCHGNGDVPDRPHTAVVY